MQTAQARNSLDKLANLLAAENLTVQHGKVETASFDLKTRVLTLPLWNMMSKELYHMMVLHEVSHALYTPLDEFKEEMDKDHGIHQFINIIEDARIERKIKVKFPGSRRDFSVGYKEILDRDFFKMGGRDINAMSFIDRLNLFFKVGHLVDLTFTDEEQKYIDRAASCVTFSEVIALAHELYGRAEKKNEENGYGEPQYGEESEGSDEASEWEDGESQESDESDEDSEDGDFSNSLSDSDPDDDSDPEDNSDPDDETPDETFSETESSLSENMISKMIDPTARQLENVFTETYGSKTYKDYVMTHKQILDFHSLASEKMTDLQRMSMNALWNNFVRNNVNNVSYLIKQFEMKKAADQYSRARTAKSGVIDVNKIHSYKFNDDVFRRNTILPGSKNHGLVMFVDFSGSMAPNMENTIEQLLNLVMFCRKVGIPHRVYGFQDQMPLVMKRSMGDDAYAKWYNDSYNTKVNDHLFLMELFTEKMNNNTFTEMSKYLLSFGHKETENSYRRRNYVDWVTNVYPTLFVSNVFMLGGTPLNASLAVAKDLINDFRRTTKVQITNLVCLTDGCSHMHNPSHRERVYIDKETKYSQTVAGSYEETKFYLEVLKRSCDVHTINFFISDSSNPHTLVVDSWQEREAAKNTYRKEKSVVTHDWFGFDDVYTIMGKALAQEDISMEDAKDNKKGTLTRIMKKIGNGRRKNRVILSRFIDRIAA